MAVVIAVIQQKGGVGKTSIVGNLAGEAVAGQQRVVALDLDSQRSLTDWAAFGDGLLKSCVRPFEVRKLPAFLAAVESAGREADVVLVDCPPGLPNTGMMAALVADVVLLPVTASVLDLSALKQAIDLMRDTQRERGGKVPAVGLVPSKVVHSTVIGRELPATLKEFHERVLPAISQRVAVAEVVMSGLTVREALPESDSAAEFRALWRAVQRMVKP